MNNEECLPEGGIPLKLYFPAELIVFIAVMIIPVILLAVLTYKNPTNKIARTGAWLLSIAMLGILLFQPREYIENSTTDMSGNTYIAAEVRSPLRGRRNLYSIKLMKFSSSGRLLWSRRHNLFGGEYARANAILVGKQGDFYLALSPENEERNFVAKVDPHGRIAWKAESSLAAADLSIWNNRLRLLGVNNKGQMAGELYEFGKGAHTQALSFSRKLEIPRRAKWVHSEGDGNILIFSKGDGSYLTKLGPDGNVLWEIAIDSEVYCSMVATDSSDHLYIAGGRRSSAYIQKLTSGGETVWEQEFRIESGEESNWVNEILAKKDGSIYAAGSYMVFTGRSSGVIRYHRSFLAGISPDGKLKWNRPLKAERYRDSSLRLGQDENGNMLFSGEGLWRNYWISLSKYSPDGHRMWRAVAPPPDITILVLLLSAMIGYRFSRGKGWRRAKTVS